MKFAANTDVPVEKSRAEIEATVTRYGASSFASGWAGEEAVVTFEVKDRRVKFILPLPSRSASEFTHEQRRSNQHSKRTVELTPEQSQKRWEQACRQRWRALALCVKAKLEAVDSDISTFDQEFMAHIVMPNGLTIGEQMLHKLPEFLAGKALPPLLEHNPNPRKP